MECVCNGNDVTATMTSECCYDVTVAAAVAGERMALYPTAQLEANAEGGSIIIRSVHLS